MSTENENKNLEVEMGKLTVQIDNLNKNFEGLSKSVPDILNKIDNQTSMLIRLIEQKDEGYHKQFVHKDVHEVEITESKTRIEKIEGVIGKLTWAVVVVVIASVLKLIIK